MLHAKQNCALLTFHFRSARNKNRNAGHDWCLSSDRFRFRLNDEHACDVGPRCLPCSVVRGHGSRIPARVWELPSPSIAAPQMLIPRRGVASISLRKRKPSGVRRDVSRLRRIQKLGQGRSCCAEANRGTNAFLAVLVVVHLYLGEVPCECATMPRHSKVVPS
jgi:hypothetical protein